MFLSTFWLTILFTILLSFPEISVAKQTLTRRGTGCFFNCGRNKVASSNDVTSKANEEASVKKEVVKEKEVKHSSFETRNGQSTVKLKTLVYVIMFITGTNRLLKDGKPIELESDGVDNDILIDIKHIDEKMLKNQLTSIMEKIPNVESKEEEAVDEIEAKPKDEKEAKLDELYKMPPGTGMVKPFDKCAQNNRLTVGEHDEIVNDLTLSKGLRRNVKCALNCALGNLADADGRLKSGIIHHSLAAIYYLPTSLTWNLPAFEVIDTTKFASNIREIAKICINLKLTEGDDKCEKAYLYATCITSHELWANVRESIMQVRNEDTKQKRAKRAKKEEAAAKKAEKERMKKEKRENKKQENKKTGAR